jgi:hypothetical protein
MVGARAIREDCWRKSRRLSIIEDSGGIITPARKKSNHGLHGDTEEFLAKEEKPIRKKGSKEDRKKRISLLDFLPSFLPAFLSVLAALRETLLPTGLTPILLSV